MAADPQVLAIGGFVPEHALVYRGSGGAAIPVDADHPLPTRTATAVAASVPLTGSTAVSGTFGPFVPDLRLTIWLTLSGTWAGTAQLLRSTDGGATKLPLTLGGVVWASFTGNAQEAIGEESVAGATYYLAVALSSGTLAYRVQQ